MNHSAGGLKNDENKPDLSLIPPIVERQLAWALMAGARKYGRNNYKKGFPMERLLASAARHISKMKEGEILDGDCTTRLGRPVTHAACAIASLAMLLECGRRGTLSTLDHTIQVSPPPADKKYRDKRRKG